MNFHGEPDQVLTIPTAGDAGVAARVAMYEPVLGYRAWLVGPECDRYQLQSVMVSAQWASTPNAWTAGACTPPAASGASLVRHDPLRVPHPECTCGIYAYHSLNIGGYDERLVLADCADIGIVWGAVLGAGQVLVYRDGWRAQFARPVAIVQGSGCERHVRGLSDQLGIAVMPGSDIERRAAELGRPSRGLALV